MTKEEMARDWLWHKRPDLFQGLSQNQLAERANLDRCHISKWETGEREPSFDNLKRLAWGMNRKAWEILKAAEAA